MSRDIIQTFYSPSNPQPDPHGRLLSTILSWPDHRLESSHNYIQTLFPLPEPSFVTPYAPLITLSTYTAFRSTTCTGQGLRSQLRLAFIRICEFYGFDVSYISEDGEVVDLPDSGTGEVGPSTASLDEATPTLTPNTSSTNFSNWVTRFDHNHLRMTRIIRSLRVLGLEKEASAFFEAVEEVVLRGSGRGIVNRRSLMFWTRAAERKLSVPPELEDDEDGGVGWLRHLEEEEEEEEG